MQDKRMSLIESISNVAVGFIIAMITWRFLICPIFGFTHSVANNLKITAIFTVISIVRGYLVRRFFNGRFHYRVKPKTERKEDRFLSLRVERHGDRGWRHLILDGEDKKYMSLDYKDTMESSVDEAVTYFCRSWVLTKEEGDES